MHDNDQAKAYWVTRQGREGQAVLARHGLVALAEVLADLPSDAAPQQLSAQCHAEGWSANVDGVVWTVRPHRASAGATQEANIEASGDTRTAASRALEAARSVVSCESGAVLLVEGNYLRFVVADGPEGPTLEGVRLPATTGVAGHAVQTQRPQVVDRAAASFRHYRAIDDITGYTSRGILAVPVIAGGVVLGVIELVNPPEGSSFAPADVERVERVARVLAGWLAARRGRT